MGLLTPIKRARTWRLRQRYGPFSLPKVKKSGSCADATKQTIARHCISDNLNPLVVAAKAFGPAAQFGAALDQITLPSRYQIDVAASA